MCVRMPEEWREGGGGGGVGEEEQEEEGGWGGGTLVPHLCSVPDDGRPGVAQFVSAGPFVVVDQQEVVLRR